MKSIFRYKWRRSRLTSFFKRCLGLFRRIRYWPEFKSAAEAAPSPSDPEASPAVKEPAPRKVEFAGDEIPPLKPAEDIDPSTPMTAPEVEIAGRIPDFAETRLEELAKDGCRALLLEPEEEFTRWFGIFDSNLLMLGSTPVVQHRDFLDDLSVCEGKAVTIGGNRFRLESFFSFNEFGDRFALQFFQEGSFDLDQAIKRRQQNIRLLNKLKPATSLTIKNEDDIAEVIARLNKGEEFIKALKEDHLVTDEMLGKAGTGSGRVLSILREGSFPRKLIAESFSRAIGADYVDLDQTAISYDAARMLDEDWELLKQAMPFAIGEDGVISVSMMDPTDKSLIKELENLLGSKVKPFCSAAQDIVSSVRKAHKQDEIG
ncbi:MAG: hypothetical protein K6G50_14005 [bacterium]|nr:hypothetical protein [bacterium]